VRFRLPLDHVVVLVADLAGAGAAFEAAGFQVLPEARHSAEMGTANRCVMLDGTYVEIMGIVAETPANAAWRRLLALGAGVRGIALRSLDMGVTISATQAQGLSVEPLRHFSRATAEGNLRFSVARIDLAETPGVQCLFCHHHTADLLWRPETMRHPNGVSRFVQVAFPEAASLSRLAGKAGVPVVAGAARLTFSGRSPAGHDLKSVCGIELEVVGP
jgi:Glyoxalase-like domain